MLLMLKHYTNTYGDNQIVAIDTHTMNNHLHNTHAGDSEIAFAVHCISSFRGCMSKSECIDAHVK